MVCYNWITFNCHVFSDVLIFFKEFSIISLYEVFKVHACSTSGAIPKKWILGACSHMIHFLRNHSATARSWAWMLCILRMFDCRTVSCFQLNGDGEIRTHDPLLARQVLSQLSYAPIKIPQPPTFPSRLQLSIIGRLSLNHRVRDVDGCFPWTHRHRKVLIISKALAFVNCFPESNLIIQ